MQPNFERRETKEFQMVSPVCGLKWYYRGKNRSNIQVHAPHIADKLENILQALEIISMDKDVN